jgi:DNA phosphorothioation-dependent restriction protein DptG
MALIDQGFEQMQKGNYAEAKENFNKALSIDAQNPYAQFNLATISEREGNNPQQAIKLYQMILDYNNAEAATNSSNPRKVASTLLQACKENIERLQKRQPMDSNNKNL